MAKNRPVTKSWWSGALVASLAIAAGLAGTAPWAPARAAEFTVYKSPWCGCCAQWVDHLKAKGHSLSIQNLDNLDLIKKMAGVPEALQSCHTAMVDGYAIEGHVPAMDIERLLAERPRAKGLAVPGMPAGAPGMAGATPDSYQVMLFKGDGSATVYAQY